MILINKYELIKELSKRKYSRASLQLIMDQPEVKAIPIDWIKSYGVKIAEKCCHCATAIWEMLEEWEKENETN